jgi:cell division septation protein DedD
MSNLFDDHYPEPEAEPPSPLEQKNRDVTLGMGALLAIFFGLVVLCAIFFGVGYQMGRHNTESAQQAAAAATTPPPVVASNGSAKPSASGNQTQAPSQPPADSSASTPDTNSAAPQPTQVASTPVSAPATAQRPAQAPVATSSGSYMVQVAAVSHEEDAQVLVSSLKRHGYNVSIRHEPQDSLTHVQVGPFATKDEAKAMQQRLHDDGYAAIVK